MKNCKKYLSGSAFPVFMVFLLFGMIWLPRAQAFPSPGTNGVQDTCGTENVSGKKILVVYESKRGSTADAAQTIADVFCSSGFQVDLAIARFVTELSVYDGVIIGTPIYFSKFLPGIDQFLENHKTGLSSKTNALFIMSTLCDAETGLPDRDLILGSFVNPVLEDYSEISPAGDIGVFGGRYDFKDLYPVELLAMSLEQFDEKVDYVNSALVEAWAEAMTALFN